MFKVVEPEVPGGLGDEAEIDYSIQPIRILKLHFEFQGWLGDDIITTTPCFLVTDRLKKALEDSHLTGFAFDHAHISKSPQFFAGQERSVLPAFHWFKIHGQPCKDDFGLSSKARLVVSEAGMNLLSMFNIKHCRIRKRPFKVENE